MSEPRNHDPDLRELVAELDGFRDLMNERDRRYESRFTASDEKTALALTASKEAVMKAESATEKRFDGVNEFRKTLSDQASSFMSRPEALAKFDSQAERMAAMEKATVERTGRTAGVSAAMAMLVLISSIVMGLTFGILNLVMKK